MSEIAIFDHKAQNYDTEFTSSYVGKIQRAIVHDFVKKQLSGKKDLKILELNCGTGQDISFLEQFGNVTATDVSGEMLKIASRKNPYTTIQKLDMNESLPPDKKYDVIFSNFGGLNCISPDRLKELNDELAQILNPEGQMFLVFMHNWSLIEFLYFTLKFEFKKAFRRTIGLAEFKKMPIYYYSKKETAKLFQSFKLVKAIPVGVLLSGEYMNTIGAKSGITEKRTPWLSLIFGADHFLFNFIKSY